MCASAKYGFKNPTRVWRGGGQEKEAVGGRNEEATKYSLVDIDIDIYYVCSNVLHSVTINDLLYSHWAMED